jgi:hypothetical protein
MSKMSTKNSPSGKNDTKNDTRKERYTPGCRFGKWRECSTIFEVKCGILARNRGIDPSSPEKAAPQADVCAPFLSIREAAGSHISSFPRTRSHENTGSRFDEGPGSAVSFARISLLFSEKK